MEPEATNLIQEYADDYKLHCKLGDGGQANVYLASKQNQLYALKVYFPGLSKETAFQAQVNHLKHLQHCHLINMVEHNIKAKIKLQGQPQEKRPMIALELAEGGELFEFISKQGRFNTEICRYYAKQIISTIEYLVEKDVTHRDLKPQNILFDSHFNIKISDFGLSRDAKGDLGDYKLRSRVGTQGYRPPEMEQGKYTGVQADMFAAGVCIFIMYNGSPPFFSTRSHDRVYRHIREKNFAKFWSMHQKSKPEGFYSDSFKRLMNCFFSADPNQRPTFESLEEDEWWNGEDISKEEVQEYMSAKASIIFENSKVSEVKKQLFKNKLNEEVQEDREMRTCECDDEATCEEQFVATYKALNIKKEDLPVFTNQNVPYSKQQPAFVVSWVRAIISDLFKDQQVFLTDYVGQIIPSNFILDYDDTKNELMTKFTFLLDGEDEVDLQLRGQLHLSDQGKVGVKWERKNGNFYWLTAIENRIVSQLKKLN